MGYVIWIGGMISVIYLANCVVAHQLLGLSIAISIGLFVLGLILARVPKLGEIMGYITGYVHAITGTAIALWVYDKIFG